MRFRVDFPVVVGEHRTRPDIVFSRARVAVFVDGCFWHGCPEHGEVPAANREFWRGKLAATAERDGRNDAMLKAAGWTVIRVWEHEEPGHAADRVERAVRPLRSAQSEVGRSR